MGLRNKFHASGTVPVVLDGDDLRECLDAKGLYSFTERLALAKTYSRLAAMLVRQNQLVIVATMSLFHEVHEMNRRLAHPYFEVFLDLPISTLRRRDIKDLYGHEDGHARANVGGLNLEVETPMRPHLHITDPHIDSAALSEIVFEQFLSLSQLPK